MDRQLSLGWEVPVSGEQQSVARLKEQGAAVRETLSGYARAAAVIERERMARLACMTPEEARAIYDGLCRSWATWGQPPAEDALERLGQWRLERCSLCARRWPACPGGKTVNEQERATWELEPGKIVHHPRGGGRATPGPAGHRRDHLPPVITIRCWLSAFAEVLEQPELSERFETPWRKMLEFRNQGT